MKYEIFNTVVEYLIFNEYIHMFETLKNYSGNLSLGFDNVDFYFYFIFIVFVFIFFYIMYELFYPKYYQTYQYFMQEGMVNGGDIIDTNASTAKLDELIKKLQNSRIELDKMLLISNNQEKYKELLNQYEDLADKKMLSALSSASGFDDTAAIGAVIMMKHFKDGLKDVYCSLDPEAEVCYV